MELATPIVRRVERSEPVVSSIPASDAPFYTGLVACVRRTVCSTIYVARLTEERDDCLQEALVRFHQTWNQRPGHSVSWYLADCRWFVRDYLRRGRSIDSPKRRWLGHPLISAETDVAGEVVPGLVSYVDPLEHAAARDDLAQLHVRLKLRERTVLELLLEGNGTRAVARRLRASPSTICESTRRIRMAALQIGLRPRPNWIPGCKKINHAKFSPNV